MRQLDVKGRRALRRSARIGAATVEFAVIAPLFLLLLGGIIEFGQAFRIKHALSNAARRGARSAVVDGATSSQITAKVRTQCVTILGVQDTDVTVDIAVDGQSGGDLTATESGDEVTVTASIPFSKAGVGFFGKIFSTAVLSCTCTLERE